MRPASLAILAVTLAFGSCDTKKTAAPPPAPNAAPAREAAPPKPAVPRAKREWVRPPSVPARAIAEGAWERAEASPSAEAWGDAATAYEAALPGCTDDCADTAYAVILARKNALAAEPAETLEPPPGDQPVPLPPRVAALVDALDVFAELAEPDDPDVAGVKFLAANVLNRWRQPDALARLEEVLREHRDHETAEYAANVLIDALVRAGRIDEVSALVEELLADAAFLAARPELRATLERLRAVIAEASSP